VLGGDLLNGVLDLLSRQDSVFFIDITDLGENRQKCW